MYQLIEILGKKALFSNSRISKSDIPEGMYRYDFREDSDNYFATIEKNVVVNYSGSIITTESIDLGESGYIELDKDSSPNFLGVDCPLQDFIDCWKGEFLC